MTANQQKDPVNLILVGKTGCGKSSTGNTILQQNVFSASSDFDSATKESCLEKGTVQGVQFKVLDTPGLFDTDQSHEEIGVLLIKAVINMHPGFHAALYVIRYGARYTEEEYAAYRRFKLLFGSDVTGHMIVVFTGGDALKAGENLDQKLLKAPKDLRAVLDDCNWRYVVFNNKAASGEKQVAGLLQQVKDLQDLNKHRPYVCAGYSELGATIEEQVGKRMREIEELEARTTEYVQNMERSLTKQLEELTLTRTQYEKEVAAIAKRLDSEKDRLEKEWELRLRQEGERQEIKRQELELRLLRESRNNGVPEAALGFAGSALKVVGDLVIAFAKK